MNKITINSEELKHIIEDALINVLLKRKDIIEDAVIDALEDFGLSVAIEEGKSNEFIDKDAFLNELNSKINSL